MSALARAAVVRATQARHQLMTRRVAGMDWVQEQASTERRNRLRRSLERRRFHPDAAYFDHLVSRAIERGAEQADHEFRP